jgi:hypothetical protein
MLKEIDDTPSTRMRDEDLEILCEYFENDEATGLELLVQLKASNSASE